MNNPNWKKSRVGVQVRGEVVAPVVSLFVGFSCVRTRQSWVYLPQPIQERLVRSNA